MPSPLTVDDLIREFLGIQPADCKHANLLRLAAALKVSGPVVRRGMVVSAKDVGDEVQVDFETRPYNKIPATETEPEREPTDEELAKGWNLPVATSIPEPPASPPADTHPASTTQTPAAHA